VNEAARIAAELRLKTADQIEAPPEKTPKGVPLRWTRERRAIFDVLGPVSLSLVATDGPVSVTTWDQWGGVKKRYGHNRGVWPARIDKGATRTDVATTKWDRNPFFFVGTQARLWFLTEGERDRSADSIVDLIALRSQRDGAGDELDKGFRDLGADLDLAMFEMELHDVAKRVGAVTWDDEALLRWFDSVAKRCAAESGIKGGAKYGPKLIERMALADVEHIRRGRQ